jgi:hypothetical protein
MSFLFFDAQWASEEAFFGRFAHAGFLAKRSSNVGFGERFIFTFFCMNTHKTGTLE